MKKFLSLVLFCLVIPSLVLADESPLDVVKIR